MSCVVRKMIICTSALLLLHVLLNGTPVSCYESSSSQSQSSSSTKRIESQQPLHRFKSLERVLNRLDGVPSTSSPKFDELSSGGFSRRSLLRRESETQDLLSLDDDDLDDEDEDSYEDELEAEFRSDKPTGHSYPQSRAQQHNYRHKPAFLTTTTLPTTTSTTTTTTTTTTPAPPQPMSYSQFKWQNFGTRQRIDAYRSRQTMTESSPATLLQRHHSHHGNNRHHNNNTNQNGHHTSSHHHHSSTHANQSNNNHSGQTRAQPQSPDTSIREAINHALKVSREGSCKDPKPRLVRVQDFYPSPGKTYVPHCTILHQCSDDTGCCRHDVLTCSPKTTQRVELAFYTIIAESNRGSSVERLVFYNHTECECRDRLDHLMPRDISVPTTSLFQVTSPEERSGQSTSSGSNSRQTSNNEPTVNTRPNNSPQCNCPSSYTERVLTDGSCTCDCFDKQKECLRLKKGRNFFTMQAKWCIQSGRCEVPDCAYGSYIHLVGRCPRKKERYGHSMSWHRYNTK